MFLSVCTYFSGSFYERYKERFMVMFNSSLGRKESSLPQRSRRRVMNNIINVKFIKTSCLSSCFNYLLLLKKRKENFLLHSISNIATSVHCYYSLLPQ